MRSLGIAAIFKAIKGFFVLGLCLCKALATNSLPAPDSPLISTVMCERANRPIARKTSCIAGASPMISGVASTLTAMVFWLSSCCCRPCKQARCARLTTSLISKGLGKYSKAPP